MTLYEVLTHPPVCASFETASVYSPMASGYGIGGKWIERCGNCGFPKDSHEEQH